MYNNRSLDQSMIALFNPNTERRDNDKSLRRLDDEGMDDRIMQAINIYDKRLLKWLVRFNNALGRENVSIDEVRSLVDMIKKFKDQSEDEYINGIFYPELNKSCRIPSLFPVPSSCFQMHLSTVLTTNTSGNISFAWNPFYLSPGPIVGSNEYSSFFVNNANTLTGNSADGNFLSTTIGMYNGMINGLYTQYRLCSASIVVSYEGRLDIVSGIIGLGVGLQQYASPTQVGTNDTTGSNSLAQFGNFAFVDDLYFSSRTMAINGTRGVYFPLDTRFQQYQNVTNAVAGQGNALNGFYFVFYGSSLPVSSSCLRVDFYCNFEATVGPAFNNIIPQSTAQSSNIDAPNVISQIVTRDPDLVVHAGTDVTKSKEEGGLWKSITTGLSDGWNFLKDNILPVASTVLPFIPGGGAAMKFLPAISKIAGALDNGSNGGLLGNTYYK